MTRRGFLALLGLACLVPTKVLAALVKSVPVEEVPRYVRDGYSAACARIVDVQPMTIPRPEAFIFDCEKYAKATFHHEWYKRGRIGDE